MQRNSAIKKMGFGHISHKNLKGDGRNFIVKNIISANIEGKNVISDAEITKDLLMKILYEFILRQSVEGRGSEKDVEDRGSEKEKLYQEVFRSKEIRKNLFDGIAYSIRFNKGVRTPIFGACEKGLKKRIRTLLTRIYKEYPFFEEFENRHGQQEEK